jgi:hypothetical protein
VYADKSPLTPMVTSRNTPGRERITVRHAAEEFLDPQTQISRVASRGGFVGRRRVIQRCLRTLKQPLGSSGAAEALVLQGMGGLGKSTLASRLLERMLLAESRFLPVNWPCDPSALATYVHRC